MSTNMMGFEASFPEENKLSLEEILKPIKSAAMAVADRAVLLSVIDDLQSSIVAAARAYSEERGRLVANQRTPGTAEITREEILEYDRLIRLAAGAAMKIRAEMTRAGHLIYGAAEVDWFVDGCEKFRDAYKLGHKLHDAIRTPGNAQEHGG